MKRSFLILLAGIIGIIVLLMLKQRQPIGTQLITSPSPATNAANVVAADNNSSRETITQAVAVTNNPTLQRVPLNITDATNISDWTNAIPGLNISLHSPYEDSWVVEQKNPTNYPSVLLTDQNGKSIQYESDFIDIEVRKNHIRRIEMHSPNMNIEDIKSLGDSLLQLMGKDDAEFNAWCEKVGNNWIDQPLFSSPGSTLPNGQSYGFETLHAFNNEKPWYVLLVVTDR